MGAGGEADESKAGLTTPQPNRARSTEDSEVWVPPPPRSPGTDDLDTWLKSRKFLDDRVPELVRPFFFVRLDETRASNHLCSSSSNFGPRGDEDRRRRSRTVDRRNGEEETPSPGPSVKARLWPGTLTGGEPGHWTWKHRKHLARRVQVQVRNWTS